MKRSKIIIATSCGTVIAAPVVAVGNIVAILVAKTVFISRSPTMIATFTPSMRSFLRSHEDITPTKFPFIFK